MKKIVATALFLLALAGTSPAWAQYPPNTQTTPPPSSEELWNFSASMTYDTGEYGTSETTDTLYMPFTLTRYFSKGEAYATVPYVYQKSPQGVTVVGGRPSVTGQVSGDAKSESGLGDIIVGGGYYLLSEESDPLDLTAAGSIKLPTADEDKGLGTGEFDETIGLEATKSLNDLWKLYLNLYYTFIGDPNGESLDDQITCSIGAGYQIDKNTELSAYYSESTALIDEDDNPRALSSYLTYTLDRRTTLLAGISVGLSDGSSDIGITGGFDINF